MIDLSNCKSLSDISFLLYGSKNYSSREKTKKYLLENDIEWSSFLKEKNKRYCLQCGKEITGKNRFKKKFCNSSCAASFNNKGKVKNGNKRNNTKCLYCGKDLDYHKNNFCSNECKQKYNYKTFIEKWINGENVESHPNYIKRFLFELHNNKCQKCGWGEINPFTNKLTLEIHHIDGDSSNNCFDNLQLLCPNCHSLTENFKSLNKNSSRVDRRTKYFKIEVLNDLNKDITEVSRCIVCGKELKNEQITFCSLKCKHLYDINKINKEDILKAYNESVIKTKTSIAKKLNISTTTLNKKIKKFNLVDEIKQI